MIYLLPILIGLLLSILGGGGSILSVPVLHYLFGQNTDLATSYALISVGVSSFIASLVYIYQKKADVKTAIFFSFPSFVVVFLVRKFLIPYIPDKLINVYSFTLTKQTFTLIIFALLVLVSSTSMVRSKKEKQSMVGLSRKLDYKIIFLEGVLVGFLTGLAGIGGGFLIVPILVNFMQLPIQLAVGTSLVIISINSVFGFMGDIGGLNIDWYFLGVYTAFNIVGVVIGLALLPYIAEKYNLKKWFGYFLMVLGIGILAKELFF